MKDKGLEASLSTILKEHNGNWTDVVQHIGDNVTDPFCRLDLYNEVSPEDVAQDTYRDVKNGRKLAAAEIRQDKYELEQLAYIDKLTGLHNRRFFDDDIDREVALADRHGRDASLIFLDVDHFKKFNDTYGHPAGDYVLSKLGKVIKDKVRKSDSPCRYGGEEFVIILPETEENGAYAAAEHLRRAVENETWEHEGRDLGKVNISLGVVKYDGSDVRTFVKKADDALYEAKKNGRNRVEIYQD